MQLVYLLATAAAFDVWERQHDGATRGEGEGNRQDGAAMHGMWPCTPIKTRLRRHGMKLVSAAADPCQLLDDGLGCGMLSLLELH